MGCIYCWMERGLISGVGVAAHLSRDVGAEIQVSGAWSVVVSGIAPASLGAAGRTARPVADGGAGDQLVLVSASRHVVASAHALGQDSLELLVAVLASRWVSDDVEVLVNVVTFWLVVGVAGLVGVASGSESARLASLDDVGGKHRVVIVRLHLVESESRGTVNGLGVRANILVSVSVNTAGQVVGVESDGESVQRLNDVVVRGVTGDTDAVVPQGAVGY